MNEIFILKTDLNSDFLAWDGFWGEIGNNCRRMIFDLTVRLPLQRAE